jgi:hypothetical protein
MHTYRPVNLRDEIPKEGGFGPPRAVTRWKKKKKMILQNVTAYRLTQPNISEDLILQQHFYDLKSSVMVFSFYDP